MTKEQFEFLQQIANNDKTHFLDKECERVAEHLSKLAPYDEHFRHLNDIKYWVLVSSDTVLGQYEEDSFYDSYKNPTFDLILCTYTDDELEKYVQGEIKKIEDYKEFKEKNNLTLWNEYKDLESKLAENPDYTRFKELQDFVKQQQEAGVDFDEIETNFRDEGSER